MGSMYGHTHPRPSSHLPLHAEVSVQEEDRQERPYTFHRGHGLFAYVSEKNRQASAEYVTVRHETGDVAANQAD